LVPDVLQRALGGRDASADRLRSVLGIVVEGEALVLGLRRLGQRVGVLGDVVAGTAELIADATETIADLVTDPSLSTLDAGLDVVAGLAETVAHSLDAVLAHLDSLRTDLLRTFGEGVGMIHRAHVRQFPDLLTGRLEHVILSPLPRIAQPLADVVD